jgi:hypothetical protein
MQFVVNFEKNEERKKKGFFPLSLLVRRSSDDIIKRGETPITDLIDYRWTNQEEEYKSDDPYNQQQQNISSFLPAIDSHKKSRNFTLDDSLHYHNESTTSKLKMNLMTPAEEDTNSIIDSDNDPPVISSPMALEPN